MQLPEQLLHQFLWLLLTPHLGHMMDWQAHCLSRNLHNTATHKHSTIVLATMIANGKANGNKLATGLCGTVLL